MWWNFTLAFMKHWSCFIYRGVRLCLGCCNNEVKMNVMWTRCVLLCVTLCLCDFLLCSIWATHQTLYSITLALNIKLSACIKQICLPSDKLIVLDCILCALSFQSSCPAVYILTCKKKRHLVSFATQWKHAHISHTG